MTGLDSVRESSVRYSGCLQIIKSLNIPHIEYVLLNHQLYDIKKPTQELTDGDQIQIQPVVYMCVCVSLS